MTTQSPEQSCRAVPDRYCAAHRPECVAQDVAAVLRRPGGAELFTRRVLRSAVRSEPAAAFGRGRADRRAPGPRMARGWKALYALRLQRTRGDLFHGTRWHARACVRPLRASFDGGRRALREPRGLRELR